MIWVPHFFVLITSFVIGRMGIGKGCAALRQFGSNVVYSISTCVLDLELLDLEQQCVLDLEHLLAVPRRIPRVVGVRELGA